MTETMTQTSSEMQALKTRLKATWESGDYGVFARYLESGALAFLKKLDLQPGERLLDIACGAGQLVIPASAAGTDATGVDIAANLVEQARQRARTAALSAHFNEGDAEDLPYPDARFDVVSSLVGAMFAPRPEKVVAEALRVCKPGGRIVIGSWTPASFVGGMFKVMGRHVPPSPLMASPMLWGDEAVLRERFGSGVSALSFSRMAYPLVYPFGPAEVVEFYRTYYGPTNRAFAALSDELQAALRRDLDSHWAEHNRATDGTTRLDSELLILSAVRA